MTIGTIAMLVGVFVVPTVLLLMGHRLRRRSPRQRSVFWGASVGYLIASCLSLYASMVPAAMWSADDTVRGLLGFWSLLIGPAFGAMVGAARARA